MPVIVNSNEEHPFLPSLYSTAGIDVTRAAHQDIRPLEILLLNLMADKISTERQLAEWLGRSPIQVNLTFAATDSYMESLRQGRQTRNTPAEHIRKFYTSISDLGGRKFDGLVISGTNDALPHDITAEVFWPEVAEILDWSTNNVFASLFLCWGGIAALRRFHGIKHLRQSTKTSGVFPHYVAADSTGLFEGFPDKFDVPVSHWNGVDRNDIKGHHLLELTVDSQQAGPGVLIEPRSWAKDARKYPWRTYMIFHPEYETDTLSREYVRDHALDPTTKVPYNYFPADNPDNKPINTWRLYASIYTRWVEAIYAATPFNRDDIPKPCT